MKQQREHWSSRIGFILAAAGSAIGLGSLWRFPYLAGASGGGAFVLLYIAFTFFIGVPVFIAELIVGRRSQKSAVAAYSDLAKHSQNWRLLGYLNILTALLILSFYCVVSGWCLNYTFMSLSQFSAGKTPEQIKDVFDTLFVSSDINIFWLIAFVLLNVGVVYSGVRKGIEHWSKILTPALLFILVCLFCYSTTLPGFGEAARFIFYPDFSKLTGTAILNALGMAFFTLSVGIGIILTYGSYLQPNENIPKTTLVVTIMNLAVSLMAALMIFPIVFSFGFEPEAGPGLVFQTMPVLFAKLKGGLVISTLFFLLFVFTALTSSISLFEILIANFIEMFGWTRARAATLTASAAVLLGIPSALSGSGLLFPNWSLIYGKDFFDTLNYITASWFMPIAGLATTLFVGWRLGKTDSCDEFMKGTQARYLFRPWFFSVRYLAPLAVLIIILAETGIIDLSALTSR